MRKISLLVFIILFSVTMSAQFKFGGIISGGVGSLSEVMPMEPDSFTFRVGGGPLLEYAGSGFSVRSGAVYQSDNKLLVPLQMVLKINRSGGFFGFGPSFDVLRTEDENLGYYDVFLGNKAIQNIDFSLGLSYPMKGGIQDALIAVRMCIFPLSTCKETCGF